MLKHIKSWSLSICSVAAQGPKNDTLTSTPCLCLLSISFDFEKSRTPDWNVVFVTKPWAKWAREPYNENEGDENMAKDKEFNKNLSKVDIKVSIRTP